MHRIPVDLDLKEIVGSEIQQICLGRYDVSFDFLSGTLISVQGDITVLQGNNIVGTWAEDSNWTSLSFQRLLNLKIIGYSVPNDRVLQINFEGGNALLLHDNSDQYESFQIHPPGREYLLVV